MKWQIYDQIPRMERYSVSVFILLLFLLPESFTEEEGLVDTWKTTTVWTEEVSLAPLGLPSREGLPMCDDGKTQDDCLHKSPNAMSWEDAHTYCRSLNGFLTSRVQYRYLDLWWPDGWAGEDNITWTALTNYMGHYQWLSRSPDDSPALSDFEEWQETPKNWSRDCAAFNLTTREFQLHNCSHQLHFFCALNNNESSEDAAYDFSDMELKVTGSVADHYGLIKVPEKDFYNLTLTCQAFSKSTGEFLLQQPQIFWRKDNVYINHRGAGLEPSTVHDSSKSESVAPGIEVANPTQLSQGTYSCESWVPKSKKTLESNKVLVTLEEWVTLIFNAHRSEKIESSQDSVKQELIDLFKYQYTQIATYIWDPISIEKEPDDKPSFYLVKHKFHVHMPRADLNFNSIKYLDFFTHYSRLFKKRNFTETSNLTFATFCYKQTQSFNSDRTLKWPFTEVGYVYPMKYKCKVEYGRLSPGLCKGDYITGAHLIFDPAPCDWQDMCPSGYTSMDNDRLCVAVSSPSDWDTGFKETYKTSQERSILDNSVLLGKGKIGTYKAIKNLSIAASTLSTVWLPVKRDRHLGPLVFQGPENPERDYWQYVKFKNYDISWAEQHPLNDQDCLAFDLETKKLQTLDCQEKLPFLAIIDASINMTLAMASPHCAEKGAGSCLCPPGWNTPIFKGENETCFKLFTNTKKVTWPEAKRFCEAELPSPEPKGAQLPSPNVGFLDWVYKQHLKDNGVSSVWMGIEWIPDRILYKGPEDNINWLPQTNYSLLYGSLKQDGWILEGDEVVKQNILCQQIRSPTVSMKLQVNQPRNEDSQTMCIDANPVQLLMNEKQPNIKCFVNGEQLGQLAHERTEDSGCQYYLQVRRQGYYQCQVWTRPPFMLAKSNVILHRDPKTYTYVITLSKNEVYVPKEHDITFKKEQRQERNSGYCPELLRKDLESNKWLSKRFNFSDTLSFYTPDSNHTKLLHSFHMESEINGIPNMSETDLFEALRDRLIANKLTGSDCVFERIRSTVGCLSDVTFDENSEVPRNLTWPQTVGNKFVISEELCITQEGEPVTRECLGDFIEGYYWAEPPHSCIGVPSNVTKTLWEINRSKANQSIGATLAELTANQSSLLPADIHFVSTAFQALSEEESNVYDFDDLVKVVSNVMGANATVFELIQRELNSSSALLEAFEELTFKVQLPNAVGDQTKKSSKELISVERIDLEANSTIIGFKSHGEYEETLLIGFKNEDLANAEAAIILPSNLTYTISTKSVRQPRNRILEKEKVPLAFAVFQNEKLFQDNISHANYIVNSRIIMATYKGEWVKDLAEPVKILFKPLKTGNDTKCVYWDFTLNNQRGGWSEAGCMKGERQGEHDVCLCNHLTNFAQLINYDEDSGFEGTHAMILDIITIIGCCLSIIGLLLVFTTFCLFKKWRRSLSNKILVNLSFSVFCSMVIFLAGINQTWNEPLCRSVAVGLHYFILASFGWMLVEAVHQYLKFVKVVGTYIPRFLWKASVCAWGIPVLPILVVLIYDHSLYDSSKDYNREFRICWMSVDGFKYAFLPPLALTMTVNLIMYSLIIHGAICGRARVNSTMSERTLFMNQLRMAVCVFFLLGFTWIFGLLAVCQLRQVFSYLFCIFNTLQGFFLFLFHVCREQGARKYWKDFLSVFTKNHLESTPGNSFNHINSQQFRGHPDSVSFDKCGGILVLPMGPPLRSHLRRSNRTSLLSARTNSTLAQSRTSFNP